METIFIWGTGQLAKQCIEELYSYITGKYIIKGFIDNNKSNQGSIFLGFPVFAPEVLNQEKTDLIVILTWAWRSIKEQIINDYQIEERVIKSKFFFYESMIRARYYNTKDEEIKEILTFIDNNEARFLNYDFANEYDKMDVDVFFDEKADLYYVFHSGKRMYFSRKYDTKEKAADYYRGICAEQDDRSPHKYLSEDFNVSDGDVVVDVGVAEGNFALDVIDKAKKVYMIEADDDWIEALKNTFADYEGKVVIIKKFLTSFNEGIYATLDELIEEPVNFIKMDIEGSEWEALMGAEKTIRKSDRLKIAACAYHSDGDEILIRNELAKHGFNIETTHGYLWFHFYANNRRISTKLNRGVLRANK